MDNISPEHEPRFPHNGMPLFKEGDQFKIENDGELESLEGPPISVGALGKAQLRLDKYAEPNERNNPDVYAYIDGSVVETDRNTAEMEGYSVIVSLYNSSVPEGFALVCNLWSEKRNFLFTASDNKASEDTYTDYNFFDWKPKNGEARSLVLPNDKDMLQSLLCNFETIQERGGDTKS